MRMPVHDLLSNWAYMATNETKIRSNRLLDSYLQRNWRGKIRFKKVAGLGRPLLPVLQVGVAEVRRFFVALLWPKTRRLISVLHWSNWRRSHQAQAKFFHKARTALRHLQL